MQIASVVKKLYKLVTTSIFPLLGVLLVPSLSIAQTADSSQYVTVKVSYAGDYKLRQWTFSGPVRLSQIYDEAKPSVATYWPLTRLLSSSRQQWIEDKREQVLTQLSDLSESFADDGDEALALSVRNLRQQVKGWPLAGSYILGSSWQRARTDISFNPLLSRKDAGNSFFILQLQNAPGSNPILGLVEKPKTAQAYDSDLTLRDVLSDFQCQTGAECDVVDIISANGEQRKVGIAYYNAKAELVEPGAVVFYGFADGVLPEGYQQLNDALIELLKYWNPKAQSLIRDWAIAPAGERE